MKKPHWITVAIILLLCSGIRAQVSNENVTLPDSTTSTLSIAEKIQNAFNFILLSTEKDATTSTISPATTTSKNTEDTTDVTDFDYITVFASTYQPDDIILTTVAEERITKTQGQNTTTTKINNINTPQPTKSAEDQELTTFDDVYVTVVDTSDYPTKQNPTTATEKTLINRVVNTTTQSPQPSKSTENTENTTFDDVYITVVDTSDYPTSQVTTTAKILKTTTQSPPKPSKSTDNLEYTTIDDVYITIVDTDYPDRQETTTNPTTSKTKTTKNSNPFKFVLLNKPTPTKTRTIETTPQAILISQQATQKSAISKDKESTSLEYETVYASTIDFEDDNQETTPISTTKTSTTKTMPFSTTTKRPTPPITNKKFSTKSTSKPTENGQRIYELQNSGINFIIKSTTKTKTKSASTTPIIEVTTEPEDWEDHFTTEESNGSLVIAGAILPPPEIAGAPLGPAAVPSVVAPNYFVNPGAFWAKYWYWILIILLLIIILFIIPGFICQIYMSRWCKRRKLDDFFEKRSHIFDFDRIGFGMHLFKPHTQHNDDDAEAGNVTSSITSESSSTSAQVEEDSVQQSPSGQYEQLPVSSLPEADIHQQELEASKPLENVTPVSENATVIVIPDPLSEIRITSLSESVVESVTSVKSPPSFSFPAAQIKPTTRPNPLETPASIQSKSDIGLDIGNETIIKSNNITKPAPVHVAPFRPPKPEHMVPKAQALDVAPESRARQKKPNRPKETQQSDSKRRDKEPSNRPRPDKKKSEHRESQKRRHNQSEDRVSKKTKPEEKRPTKPKKKAESSTQSLMKAAKSLEDLLDAITKLTREYPVPDLPEVQEKETKKQSKPHREKSIQKRKKEPSDLPKKFSGPVHDEMMRNKEKRTKNWASEQRKLEKSRDRKRSKEKREPSRRREKDRSRKRQKKDDSKRETGKGKERKDKTPKPEKKEKIPTLVKEEITPQDKVKQERRRMRLERDLKKLQKYHNAAAKKEEQVSE